MSHNKTNLVWQQVAATSEIEGGCVKSVATGAQSLALVHFDDQSAATKNSCPHQGGPLGAVITRADLV